MSKSTRALTRYQQYILFRLNVVVLICSDHMVETKRFLGGKVDVWCTQGNPPEVDMCVLSNDHNMIMTVRLVFGLFWQGRKLFTISIIS